MWSFSLPLRLTLAAIAVAARCVACSVVYIPISVGRDFGVKVENQSRPVEGLRLEVVGAARGGDSIVAVTDRNGLAFFRGIQPGTHSLNVAHTAGAWAGAAIEVKMTGPRGVIVPIQWPSVPVLHARLLRGTIRGPGYFPGQAQPRLSLDLVQGTSGEVLQTLVTRENGEFNFEGIPAGLYFVHLKPDAGNPMTGFIAVEVARDAPADHLELDLGWTSCGLYYSDAGQCRASDLHTNQLSGHIVDSGGAAIARARIFLLDPAGTVIENLQSDLEGQFASSRPIPSGAYKLVITSGGFTPYRGTLIAEPNPAPASATPFTVHLGLLGSCSSDSP